MKSDCGGAGHQCACVSVTHTKMLQPYLVCTVLLCAWTPRRPQWWVRNRTRHVVVQRSVDLDSNATMDMVSSFLALDH